MGVAFGFWALLHGSGALSGASELLPAYGTVRCFITQSTAEAEVVACNEACQCGESTGALLEVLGYGGVRKHMRGDSKSGISQLTADTVIQVPGERDT